MFPLGSISALINSPHLPPFILFGSVGQLSTRRYGLGSWVCLGYRACWVCATPPNAATATTTNPGSRLAWLTQAPFGIKSETLVRRVIIISNLTEHSRR